MLQLPEADRFFMHAIKGYLLSFYSVLMSESGKIPPLVEQTFPVRVEKDTYF